MKREREREKKIFSKVCRNTSAAGQEIRTKGEREKKY
jgi:hypothetical protein